VHELTVQSIKFLGSSIIYCEAVATALRPDLAEMKSGLDWLVEQAAYDMLADWIRPGLHQSLQPFCYLQRCSVARSPLSHACIYGCSYRRAAIQPLAQVKGLCGTVHCRRFLGQQLQLHHPVRKLVTARFQSRRVSSMFQACFGLGCFEPSSACRSVQLPSVGALSRSPRQRRAARACLQAT